MAHKKISSLGALVYSTDPNFKLAGEIFSEEVIIPAEQQKLQVRLDKKHRGGKAVTLIEGFIGKDADRETLGKNIKSFCGTGGAVKEGEIMVQGDNRDKVLQWLLKNGYKNVKKIG